MSKITIVNGSRGDLILPSGAAIRAGGETQIDADVWAESQKHPVVKAWVDDGWLAEVATNADAAAGADAPAKGKAKG